MFRKVFIPLVAAAIAGVASSANAAVNIQLTIVASDPGPVTDPAAGDGVTQFVGGTWQVYATLTGDTSSTLGLGGLQIDVTGAGGVAIEDHNLGDLALGTTVDLPATPHFTPPSTVYGIGFNLNSSPGNMGQAIAAYQPATRTEQAASGANSAFTNILTGVGLAAGNTDNNVWDYPVLVADGYYVGSGGSLTVSGASNFASLLPATLPPPTVAGAPFQQLNVDTVNGASGTNAGTATVTIVPEPASLGMLALGGLALLARRRKTA